MHAVRPRPNTDANGSGPAGQVSAPFIPCRNVEACWEIETFGSLRFQGQQIVTENFVTTRIDHKFSDRDSLFGTYLYDKTPIQFPRLIWKRCAQYSFFKTNRGCGGDPQFHAYLRECGPIWL